MYLNQQWMAPKPFWRTIRTNYVMSVHAGVMKEHRWVSTA